MLEQHLVCAALEHPLSFLYDEIYFGSGLESAVMTLKNKGLLVCNISQDKSAQIWSYIGHEVLAHLNAVPLMQLIEWRKYLHFWFLSFVCACFFFFQINVSIQFAIFTSIYLFIVSLRNHHQLL